LGAGEQTVLELKLIDRDLEQMRGDRPCLYDDLLVRHVEGRAADGAGTRTAGALAEKHLVGVALHVVDLLRIEPEAVADDLLEGGLMALAVIAGAGVKRRRAGAVEADFRAFEA